jgi:predicted acylesterase/phospholipase RssA
METETGRERRMTNENGHKRAVILSGGGANGAYEVGVLKALFSGLVPACKSVPLEPDIFTGTSIGAFNAAFLVSRWETYGSAAVSNLEAIWLDKLSRSSKTRTPNNGYRFLANPAEYFDPRNFLSDPVGSFRQFADDSLFLLWDFIDRFMYIVNPQEEEPLTERVLHTLAIDSLITREPFNKLIRDIIKFDSIRRSSRVLRIATTNWETGEVVEFTNYDFTDKLGPRIIMASSAIPGFFTPQEVGAQPYVDGSVLMNTPLNPAIKEGADIIHVVYLDPDVASIPIHYLSNVLSTLYRTQVINWAHTVNESIRSARDVNDSLALIRSAQRQEGMPDVSEKGVMQALIKFGGHLEEAASYRMLTIHRYHPRDELGGPLSLLDLRRERIEYLVERGFHDAVNHNCRASKCVLPAE